MRWFREKDRRRAGRCGGLGFRVVSGFSSEGFRVDGFYMFGAFELTGSG